MGKTYKISWPKVFGIALAFVFVIAVMFAVYPKGNTSKSESTYTTNINLMKEAGLEFFKGNNLPTVIGTTNRISLSDMVNSNLLIEFLDDQGNTCNGEDSYVQATKNADGDYSLKVFLSCANRSDYIITAIKASDTNATNTVIKGEIDSTPIKSEVLDSGLASSNSGTSSGSTSSAPVINNSNVGYITNGSASSGTTSSTTSTTGTTIYNINYINNNCSATICCTTDTCTNGIYYSVTYDANGGTVQGSSIAIRTVRSGSLAEVLYPTREGYRFTGWYLNDVLYDFATPVRSKLTLVAKWELNNNNSGNTPHTITFNSNGGSSVPSQTVDEGGLVSRPQNPTKACNTFIGWFYYNSNGNLVLFNFNTAVYSDMNLIAKWQDDGTCNIEDNKYTVTFDSNGGTKVQSQIVSEGSSVVRPSNPTKECNDFVDWYYRNASGSLVKYNFSNGVYSNITLIAQWRDNGTCDVEDNTYTVTFNTDGGRPVPSKQTVEEGKTATRPSNPTKECNDFVDWYYYNASGSLVKYNFNNGVYSSITLYAKWRDNGTCDEPEPNSYTVKFDSNGGSKVSLQTVEEGKTATRPSDPTRSGYNFVGWYLNNSAYNFNTRVYDNITLVAKWEEIQEDPTPNTYTVKFDSNGGSRVSPQTVEEGKTATRPSDPTRSGYNFVGWYLNNSAYNFNTRVYDSITLVAKWDKAEEEVYFCKIKEKTYYSTGYVFEYQGPTSMKWIIRLNSLSNVTNVRITDRHYLYGNDYYASFVYDKRTEMSMVDSNYNPYPDNGNSVVAPNASTFESTSLKSNNFNESISEPYKVGNYWYVNVDSVIYNFSGVSPYYATNLKANVFFVPYVFKIAYTDKNDCILDVPSNAYKYSGTYERID